MKSWNLGRFLSYSAVYIFHTFFLNYLCRFPALWACTWQTVVCLCKLDCSWEGEGFWLFRSEGTELLTSVSARWASWPCIYSMALQQILRQGKLQPAEQIYSNIPARITPQSLNMADSRLWHGKMLRFQSRIFFTLKMQEIHLSHFSYYYSSLQLRPPFNDVTSDELAWFSAAHH